MKVAYWAAARWSAGPGQRVRAPTEGRVGAGGDRAPARPGGRSRPGRARPRSSRWSGPASASAARCCAGRSPGSSVPDAFELRRRRPGRRAEELDVAAWGRLAAAAGGDRRRRRRRVGRRRAAKLTLSLRIVGVRPDGYHLIDAEMVTLTWPTPSSSPPVTASTWSTPDPATGRPASVPAGADNLVRRALVAVGRQASVRLVQADPRRRRPRRRLGRRRGRAALGRRAPIWPWPPRSAPTSRSA